MGFNSTFKGLRHQSQSYSLLLTLKQILLFYTKFTHSNTGQFSIRPLHETGEFMKPVTN
jgi:hypothetical protein